MAAKKKKATPIRVLTDRLIKKRTLRDRAKPIRKQQKLDPRELDGRVGVSPISPEKMARLLNPLITIQPKEAPLVGSFTSRGRKFTLEYEGHDRYAIFPWGHEEGVVRNLPPIGLIAASSLMCAFEDAVARVNPQPQAPIAVAEDRIRQLDCKVQELERSLEVMHTQRDEARRTIDVFARATVTR